MSYVIMEYFYFSLSLSLSYIVTPMDYENDNTDILLFASCQTRSCINITIVDDSILELVESFDVTLERTAELDERISLLPVDGVVEIIDNDGMLLVCVCFIMFCVYSILYYSGCGWSGGDFHFSGRGCWYNRAVCYCI